mmetsp:Transcript_13192/g.35293  ORF Transcript_13192/g.35293 Transcript_13192/m.35293 type:complete len:211 (-) Transcript_13192:2303-2935(-)
MAGCEQRVWRKAIVCTLRRFDNLRRHGMLMAKCLASRTGRVWSMKRSAGQTWTTCNGPRHKRWQPASKSVPSSSRQPLSLGKPLLLRKRRSYSSASSVAVRLHWHCTARPVQQQHSPTAPPSALPTPQLTPNTRLRSSLPAAPAAAGAVPGECMLFLACSTTSLHHHALLIVLPMQLVQLMHCLLLCRVLGTAVAGVAAAAAAGTCMPQS